MNSVSKSYMNVFISRYSFDMVQQGALAQNVNDPYLFHCSCRIKILEHWHVWVFIIKASAHYTVKFSVSNRRWNVSLSFIILNLVQFVETHVGRKPRLSWLLLEIFTYQFPTQDFFIGTAKSIIVGYFWMKGKGMTGALCLMARTASVASDSSTHIGCHEWILANTSNAPLKDESFSFSTLRWSTSTF